MRQTTACIATLLALAFLHGCDHFCRSSSYLIPNGFVGEIRVEYEIDGAPELPIENDRYVITIPASGLLKTSTRFEAGWRDPDVFYYVSSKGRTPLITGNETRHVGDPPPPPPLVHGGSVGSSSDLPTPTEYWFIGPDKQYKAYQTKTGN